jgi:hypothetical protein
LWQLRDRLIDGTAGDLVGVWVVHVAPRCAVAAFEGGMKTPQWQGYPSRQLRKNCTKPAHQLRDAPAKSSFK